MVFGQNMLQQLRIQNYVLIDDLEMNVSKGLTIITGETGAGKTILLGALSLILGQRADTSVLRDKSKKCIIEGFFDISNYRLQDFFKNYELDPEPITTLRREISAEGKSRAFINDTPVNLNQLKELGSQLVDIHSQHETLTIQQSAFQLNVVDAFCTHQELLNNYRNEFVSFRTARKRLDELIESEARSKADQDYFQFQFNELEQAAIVAGEQDNLQMELETLTHSEDIKARLVSARNLLQDEEGSIVSRLEEVNASLRMVAPFNAKIGLQAERIKSCLIELKDITGELESLDDEIQYDAARIGFVNERLDMIYSLQQKHRVNSMDGLLEIRERLSADLLRISSLDDEINKMKAAVEKMLEALTLMASRISDNRKNASGKIEKEIRLMLAEVGMPHAQIKIEQQPAGQLNESGADRIRFLFSANKGTALQELSKVASGGEMSRLMLCIKALMAKLVTLPTIVFDEIDSGISGEIAFKVGSIIEKISARHQVMVITHLPQMASRGDAHLQVFKKITGKVTLTGIRSLARHERINEIAKMLSGEELSDAALENAKELLAR